MPKGLNTPLAFRVASMSLGSTATITETTGNLRTAAITATGRAIQVCDSVSLVLNVATNTGSSITGLDVSLQHSSDGGTTWTIAEQFARVTTSTDQQTLTFRGTGLGIAEVAARYSTTTGTNAVIAQNLVLAPDQRISATYTGTGTKVGVFTVDAICQPMGTAGV